MFWRLIQVQTLIKNVMIETVTNDYPSEIVNAWVNSNEPHPLSWWNNIDHDFIIHFLAQTDF